MCLLILVLFSNQRSRRQISITLQIKLTLLTNVMQKRCVNIRDNYQLYQALLNKGKGLPGSQIVLEKKQGNWKENTFEVFHDSDEPIQFCAAKKQFEPKYGLKIFIKQFIEAPVYYFDSDGPSHFNNDGKTKLTQTPVKTPHINYYDENGLSKAKRNQFIDDNEQDLQGNINLGMHFFCGEINLNQNSIIPEILLERQSTLFSEDNFDIHEGIEFIDED